MKRKKEYCAPALRVEMLCLQPLLGLSKTEITETPATEPAQAPKWDDDYWEDEDEDESDEQW